MSDKNTKQKYFIGNWIQHKEKPELIALIHGIFDNDSGDLFYDIAFIGSSENIQGFCGQEDLEKNYKLIPFPWQLFFKVGDKVKVADDGQEGKIVASCGDPEVPIEVHHQNATYRYAPHELIKIGE